LHTGVADYAAALLPALRQFGDVDVGARSCDIALYHLGNNQLHRDIYARALAQPGVAVLHDAVLQHFFLGSLTEQQYIEEFVFNYGEWSRSEAQALWNDRARSSQDPRFFARPMLRRAAETSRAIVVHNGAAAAMVREHAPHARVIEIRHLFVPPPEFDPACVLQFHGPCDYLFCVFGYLRESKRLLTILKAFARLHRVCPRTSLLIAGEMHSSDLARAVEPLLAAPGVRRIGRMSDSEFALASAAVDCCVNLRYPSAGETSGIAVRMMGIGKPLILTEGPENSSLPAASYLPVESGSSEEAHLFESMALVASSPQLGRDIGIRAKEHVLRYHSLQAVAGQYWKALCDSCL
jgi:glycosyltransferase involved in cell wall biosynthesis